MEFERTKEILGRGNSAGDIVVLRDKFTDTEHAQKTVRSQLEPNYVYKRLSEIKTISLSFCQHIGLRCYACIVSSRQINWSKFGQNLR